MKHVLFSLLALVMVFHADVCHAQSFTPTKRVMVEDHTIGQAWSGWWSPRGIVFLDQFMTETPAMGYEVACIHGNAGANMFGYNNFDAMYLAEYSDPRSAPVAGGWPSFILDRKDGRLTRRRLSFPSNTAPSQKTWLCQLDHLTCV